MLKQPWSYDTLHVKDLDANAIWVAFSMELENFEICCFEELAQISSLDYGQLSLDTMFSKILENVINKLYKQKIINKLEASNNRTSLQWLFEVEA